MWSFCGRWDACASSNWDLFEGLMGSLSASSSWPHGKNCWVSKRRKDEAPENQTWRLQSARQTRKRCPTELPVTIAFTDTLTALTFCRLSRVCFPLLLRSRRSPEELDSWVHANWRRKNQQQHAEPMVCVRNPAVIGQRGAKNSWHVCNTVGEQGFILRGAVGGALHILPHTMRMKRKMKILQFFVSDQNMHHTILAKTSCPQKPTETLSLCHFLSQGPWKLTIVLCGSAKSTSLITHAIWHHATAHSRLSRTPLRWRSLASDPQWWSKTLKLTTVSGCHLPDAA